MTATASATDTKAIQARGEISAWQTMVRGLRLSPELRVGLTWTAVLALLATAGRTVVPIVVQQILDRGPRPDGSIDMGVVRASLLWAIVAIGLTAGFASWMNVRLAAVVETALSNLRVRAFAHIHDLSMLHQASEQRGALVSRVTTDLDEISRFMQWGGLNAVTAAGQLVVALLVMLIYSWQLTVVVIVLAVPFVFAARWFQQRLTVASLEVRRRLADLLGRLAEVVVGAEVIRAYGIEEQTRDQLDEVIDQHRHAGIRAGRLTALFSATSEFFNGAATAAVLVAGTVFAVDGRVSVGTLVAFLFLVSLFVEPVQIAAETVNEGQNAVAGWRRVLDVLDVAPDVADPGADGLVIPDGPVGVMFADVAFRYPLVGEVALDASGPNVLEDIAVLIEPQTHVAIVGETGSGKTTFAKLLTRLMDPSEGSIELAGLPIGRIRFSSLRRRVVMVPQDGALFAGSIASNLRHGRPDASDDDLLAAMAELGLSEWVADLPAHLETPAGERGSSLSAGERQLVALTRAYLADPDLLVLDEATSAVDPATEQRLQRALAGLTRGRTTVTIAHRMATAEQADRVLVFDHGQIVEDGPHAQLVEDGGVYAHLHRAWQAGVHSDDVP